MSHSQSLSQLARHWAGLQKQLSWMLECLKQFPVTLTVALAALVVATLSVSPEIWVFNIQTFDLNHWWSLLTCHLVHFNGQHLFWDLVVFVGVGAALERKSSGLLVATVLLSGMLIPPLAVCWPLGVSTYRGLSGIDTAMFAAFATYQLIHQFREKNWTECWLFGLLLLAMVGKSLYELATGSTVFVGGHDFVPLPIAHLAGAGIGTVLAGIWSLFSAVSPTAREESA